MTENLLPPNTLGMLLDDNIFADFIGLSGDEVFFGLIDYGLFAEKIPPCFTSKGLATIAGEYFKSLLDEDDESKLKDQINRLSHDYIRYEALRDINIPRHFGVPHPESYAVQAIAIKKHWSEIKAHNLKPKPQVSRVYIRHVGGGRIFEMNYKGSDRYQFEEDEIGWMAGAEFLVKADISACFPSIYTHSIPWALNGRENSKKKRGLLALSGNLLDKCTQNTRDKQTNGLLIGPHASNLISEIILTRVDCMLQENGHTRFKRYIDDYEFIARTYDEALRFLRDLGLGLREYELTINEKKTRVLPLPRPSAENWVRELNRFAFPKDDEEVHFTLVRSFLDLALELSQSASTSAPLNYALKMMPLNLNDRAKRLYVNEATNLALAYPYLAPVLDKYVFERYVHQDINNQITNFAYALVQLGIRKIYPDSIIYGIYYALKFKTALPLGEDEYMQIIALDDCLATVILLEYANLHGLDTVQAAIAKRSIALKTGDRIENDRQWLLAYQTWNEKELSDNGQKFLAKLKSENFNFVAFQ